MNRIYEEIATSMFRSATSVDAIEGFFASLSQLQTQHREASALAAATAQANALQAQGTPAQRMPVGAPPPGMELPQTPAAPIRKDEPKVGRNDPCPCGSGRKYKKCCGAE